jgi:hypothetical protein
MEGIELSYRTALSRVVSLAVVITVAMISTIVRPFI